MCFCGAGDFPALYGDRIMDKGITQAGKMNNRFVTMHDWIMYHSMIRTNKVHFFELSHSVFSSFMSNVVNLSLA